MTHAVPRPRERGQALVETAITLPAIFLLLFGFLAVLIRIEAQVELDTATSLALASCVSARENSPDCYNWAEATYDSTMHQYSYIQVKPGSLHCPGNGTHAYTWGESVTCSAEATLLYRNTPMAYLVLTDVTITSTATTTAPSYRSQ
jgi:Flp pilus assembly protein TadG